MRSSFKQIVLAAFTLIAFSFVMQGCAEHRYYHANHHHTRGWYERRHRDVPAGVTFDVNVH